jgi:hypothetical protein
MSRRILFTAALALLLGGCAYYDYPDEPAYPVYYSGGYGVPRYEVYPERAYSGGIYVDRVYTQRYYRPPPPRPVYGQPHYYGDRIYHYNGGSPGDRAYPNRFDYSPHLGPPGAPPRPSSDSHSYRPPAHGQDARPGRNLSNGHPAAPSRHFGGSTHRSPSGGYRR